MISADFSLILAEDAVFLRFSWDWSGFAPNSQVLSRLNRIFRAFSVDFERFSGFSGV